jgi:hypothetical protein
VPYLGNDLQVAQPSYRNIDDISGSFNSSTTSFPLLVSGAAPVPFPINSNQCLISVAGVVQRPDDSGTEGFRISGGNIIFSSAPSTGADFFGVILAGADYVNVGANFPSGSAAVPSITFDSDLDTGIYNSAANQVSITTAGTERLRIDSAGQIEAVSLGTAAAPSFSFTTDPNTGIYSPGADQVAISTNGSGRLFVDSSGRTLIGTSSSSSVTTAGDARLQIVGNSAGNAGIISLSRSVTAVNTAVLGQIVFADNVGRFAQIEAECDGTPGTNDYPGLLKFSTTRDSQSSPLERMRITNLGETAIGTTNNGLFVGTTQGAGTTYALFIGRRSITEGSAFTTGVDTFVVYSNGNVQNTNNSYGGISDIKLKENIVDSGSQWVDIKAFRVRKYNLKEGQTHTQIGLVAQEAELVSPGLVYETPDRDEEGNDLGTVTKSINYSVLYMKAVKALQEAMERIEALEAKVAALEAS